MGAVRVLRLPLPLVLGLSLHLVCTLHGLPVGYALAGAKADERQVLLGVIGDPALAAGLPGQVIESVNDTLKGQIAWNGTAGAPSTASPSASCSASWPSPPPCGTTTPPARPSSAR